MLAGKRIAVVMPAYNAAQTLSQTLNEIPSDLVDDIILVDDFSQDDTVKLAHKLGISHVISHQKNMGYGVIKKHVLNMPFHWVQIL